MEDAQRPRKVAERLLEWLAVEGEAWLESAAGAATPLDRLAVRIGLDVATFHPGGRRAETLGWLEPDENLVYLREGLSETARRFTLAHEIGHALLHRPGGLARLLESGTLATPEGNSDGELPGCAAPDLDVPADFFASGDETLTPSQAYSARARRESEANAFASHLLLPAERLRRAYLARTRRAPGYAALRSLAREFGVSQDVLLRRLAALLAPPADVADDQRPAEGEGTRVEGAAALDRWQREAAEAAAPALIVAGPGTGKTSTLVGRVAYLVRERGVAPERVLALTFSNKAAREMRERLERLLRPPVSGADAGLPEHPLPTVSTIHAFCGDLLRRYAPLAGLRPDFRLITETDGYLLLRSLAPALDLDHYQPLAAPALHFPTLLGAISRAKDELVGPEEYAEAARALREGARTPEEIEAAERAEEVARVYAAYQAAVAARGDADFGDIVRLAVGLLRAHPDVLAEVRAEHEHVVVDEFQDINRAMGVLLRLLSGPEGGLWAVGDANQAIYRFRGASPANLARFNEEYPAAHVHTLRRNYRSVPAVLEAASAVACAALDSPDATLEPARETAGGPAITLAAAADEGRELAGLVAAIQERADAGRPLGEQVVLCRTRRQCQRVAAALAEAGLETHLAAPLLEEPDVKDVLAVISLAAGDSGMGLLRAGSFADHSFSPADARTLLRVARERHVAPLTLLNGDLREIEGLSAKGRRGLRRLSRIVARLRQAPDTVTGLARYAFGLTSLGRRLLAGVAEGDDALSSRAAHLAQLLALANAYEDQRRAAEPAAGARRHKGADWTGLLDYVRVVSVLRQEAGGQQETPGEGGGVRVLTVHASKGLEFPVVYLPGLADRRFPMQRRAQAAPLPPGLGDIMPGADTHLAEEACLFYVAVTRARDELVLSHAEQYGRMRYKPSPFLAPLIQRLGADLRRVAWTRRDQPEVVRRAAAEPRRRPREERLPVVVGQPVRAGALETYNRCPRQYAYRYVYRLAPREVGLATLRQALHETLAIVRAREAAGDSYTLGGALAAFEATWEAAMRQEADEAEVEERDLSARRAAFVDLYRRHGRAVIERLWAELSGADSEPHATVVEANAIRYDQP
ncbi:MAG TPA: ATP-dependent helicase, partial [Ktedonobacterales bacterium]|nr:ATP-dependent helicase [Ktedonobacterales bacterium]